MSIVVSFLMKNLFRPNPIRWYRLDYPPMIATTVSTTALFPRINGVR
jgi:hypothetical protein